MKHKVELKASKPTSVYFEDMPSGSYGVIVETSISERYLSLIVLKLNNDMVISMDGVSWWTTLSGATEHKVRLLQSGEKFTVTVDGYK